MIISYKQFATIMQIFIDLQEKSDNFSLALQTFSGDVEFTSFHSGYLLDSLLAFMEDIMYDKNMWIKHWVYELDYGKESKKLIVKYNGKVIPMKTIKDLYNLLEQEYIALSSTNKKSKVKDIYDNKTK